MPLCRRALAVVAAAVLWPSWTVAAPADWQAVVIGQPGAGAQTAFGDAYHASRALTAGGIDIVQMLRDAPRPEVAAGLATLRGAERVVIYYAGPLDQDGGGLALRGGTLAVADLLADLVAGGTRQIALLIEDCAPGGAGTIKSGLTVPDIPDTTGVFVAASAGPRAVCPGASGRLTDLLLRASDTAGAPRSLRDVLSGVWTLSTLSDPLRFESPGSALAVKSAGETPDTGVAGVATRSPVQVAGSVAARMGSVIPIEMAALSPVIIPAGPGATVSPVSYAAPLSPQRQGIAGAGAVQEAVVVFAAPDASQIVALPQSTGLPDPSIIVGLIDGAINAVFAPVAEPGDVSSTEIAYDNLVARRALRAQDAALFENLVAAGAFDPPGPLLARALQSELARMGCYNAGIDGIWGGGSRSSVARYFAEIPQDDAETLEPTVNLFRQIIRRDDVACPVPVAVAAPRQTAPARANTTNRPAQARTAAPARAPAVQRAPAPAPAPQRTIQSGTTLGVFR